MRHTSSSSTLILGEDATEAAAGARTHLAPPVFDAATAYDHSKRPSQRQRCMPSPVGPLVAPPPPPLPPPRGFGTPVPLLVWREDGPFAPRGAESNTDALMDIAMQEGPCESEASTHRSLAKTCLMDGLTLKLRDGKFETDGASPDSWMRSESWHRLASNVHVIVGALGTVPHVVFRGGVSGQRLGSGTFNVVVKFADNHLPSWLSSASIDDEIAIRLTRSDLSNVPKDEQPGEPKYTTFLSSQNEISNALFASTHEIGVKVYAVSAFSAPRRGRSLRYATVIAMRQGSGDLRFRLNLLPTEASGNNLASDIIRLLFRVSRRGVAFLDIKPANLLYFEEKDKSSTYRLADCDHSFFVVTKGRDWRALLLLNLALLAAHISNFDPFPARNGFLKGVKPILSQLVRRRGDYDSDWLFATPAVCTAFEPCHCRSDFELQHAFAAMCTHYFYGPQVSLDTRSKSIYKWDLQTTKVVERHWSSLDPRFRNSWSDQSSRTTTTCKPLIEQLVDFCFN